MTREETAKILSVIGANYSNFKPENKTETIDAWNWTLEEYSYSDIGQALRMFMKTNGGAFAPNPAQLIALIDKPNQIALEQSYTEEGEAWALVRKALSNGAYHSQEEFEKLPELVQRAIGSASILKTMAIDTNFNEAVESSNFKRQYRNLVEKDKEFQRLPIEFKQRIEQKGALLLGN